MIMQIIEKMNEGGGIFTYPVMVILVIITIHLILAFRNKQQQQAHANIIKNLGWFAFGWSSFGKAIGLIVAFDTLKTIQLSEITAQQLAVGLRMALLCPL